MPVRALNLEVSLYPHSTAMSFTGWVVARSARMTTGITAHRK